MHRPLGPAQPGETVGDRCEVLHGFVADLVTVATVSPGPRRPLVTAPRSPCSRSRAGERAGTLAVIGSLGRAE
jgi:hypothetical protein